ncbi:MAG: peptidase M23 [Alphaproteobacteria bacterium PRO2]|nr:peptidase M23 [Alphaproteobacteria bacterium PRO2]
MFSMLIGTRLRKSVLSNAFMRVVPGNIQPAAGSVTILKHRVGSLMTSLNNTIALHRFLRLRHRHIFTRHDRIRLRYVAGTAVCAAVGLFSIFSDTGAAVFSRLYGNPAAYYAALNPAGGEGGENYTVSSLASPGLSTVIQDRVSDGMRRASLAIQKAPKRDYRDIEIGRGDTLAGVLQEAGVTGADSYQVVKALSEHYDPRGVKPGQKISVHFKPGTEDVFTKMTMQVDPIKEITVLKDGDKFATEMSEKKLVKNTYAGKAEIETSLYGSAARAGIPSAVIADMIRIYSWNIDFQRDIQPGDKMEVMYEAEETEDGEYAKFGNILYANLTVGGKDVQIYRYEMADGRVDYFQPNGFSIRKTLMKTPIDGARISSGFGLRRHPVLGYNKMHKGVDFAAPTGTPIYAAGDGILEYAGRFSSYGNYIRIRHNSQLKTAYAHMHRLGKGMKVGARVSQGDVIGYVGTTGRSTGPHLHYEVMLNNKQVNPKSVNLPTGEQLTGKEFQKFKSYINTIHQQYVSRSEGMKFAQNFFFPGSAKGLN